MEKSQDDKDYGDEIRCEEHEVKCRLVVSKDCKALVLTIFDHKDNAKRIIALKIAPIKDDFTVFDIDDNQLSLLKYFLECDDLERNMIL